MTLYQSLLWVLGYGSFSLFNAILLIAGVAIWLYNVEFWIEFDSRQFKIIPTLLLTTISIVALIMILATITWSINNSDIYTNWLGKKIEDNTRQVQTNSVSLEK